MAKQILEFAQDDEDAKKRAALHADNDPLPSVPHSLLSSAEIHDYARLTGMLHPFYPDALKTASYEAYIRGKAIFWDQNRERYERELKRGDKLELAANSITFVEVEPVFRLPNYIAIRFNLRITHVHRGLLLGTGPLVDPGFEGKLLIPLHNLTSSPYELDTDKALIWIEFTKTTFNCRPTENEASKNRQFVPFPNEKKNISPSQYLYKANIGRPIRSSIPEAVSDAEKLAQSSEKSAAEAQTAATKAEKTIRRLQRRFSLIGVLSFSALLIALAALHFQVRGMIQSSIAMSASVDRSFAPLIAENRATTEKTDAMQVRIEDLSEQINDLVRNASAGTKTEAEMATIKTQVESMLGVLDQLRRDFELIKSDLPSGPSP